MRFTPLLILAVLLSFGSGYYALFIQGEPVLTKEDISKIAFLKKKFKRTHRAKKIINISSLYNHRHQDSLIKPVNLFNGSYDLKKTVYSTSNDCFKSIKGLINFTSFEKAYIWEEFRCGKRKYLSPKFLKKAPYLHPSGISYAYLVFQVSDKSRPSNEKLLKILPYFHISELYYLKKIFKVLPGDFDYLAELSDSSAVHFLNNSSTILTENYFITRSVNVFNIFENTYEFYDKSFFEKHAFNYGYRTSENNNSKTCFFRDEGVCWSYNFKKIIELTSFSKLIVLMLSVIITLLVIWQIMVKIKQQKFEDNKRRLALQVLTHEFRTPITSLLLTMENLNEKIDSLPDEIQEDFLRMSGDIYRLQRLTETSRNYLRSENHKNLVNLNKQEVPSVNELLNRLLDPYYEMIDLVLLEKDSRYILDEYWFGICLKNLVENAFNHGKGSVKIHACIDDKNKLVVSVGDDGVCAFTSLNQITKPFVKGNKSTGTGLGLNIVKNVVEAMGGVLSFDQNPTTFKIILKGAV
ncbi:MAG: two-component sensor histidine kinase/transcriptional regulator with XRE-family HTH domain [Thermoproteota archaeon]|jgi:two-component sensor histidine kinase/transcriptional regulator with XRE-family HTH domain